MKAVYDYNTPIGKVRIAEDGNGITVVSLISEKEGNEDPAFDEEYEWKETKLLKEAAKQLTEYFEGTREKFDLNLNPQGSLFQKKVWDALKAIPYGETRSYMQIAEAVGNKKASRAVGMANHNNPIMCIIPCHRVIGANGKLVGYAGGLDIKEKLLNLEKEKKGSKKDE